MTKPAKRESAEPEAERKSAFVTAEVLWCGNAWNVTPQEAAQQVVADLFDRLARGGNVSVRVAELDGTTQTLEVTAPR